MKLIDMHCDTLWKLMDSPDYVNLKENMFSVDMQKMKQAGSIGQFFACFIYMKQFTGADRYSEGYAYAKQMIERAKREFSENEKEIRLTRNWKEMNLNNKNEIISAFLTVEEGGILDNKMRRLEELYGEGVRLITLLWNEENCIGYPNSREENVMQKGLKPFGVSVVEQMNHLGMIIDVSHLSDGGFWDVMRISNAPVVASHSNMRSLCDHPRNLSDDMFRAIAEKGGVAGLNFYPYFVNSSGKASVSDLARHVEHMIHVGGEDAAAIGTDFDGFDEGESELSQISEIERLYSALKSRGITERQQDKVFYRNISRVIQEVL